MTGWRDALREGSCAASGLFTFHTYLGESTPVNACPQCHLFQGDTCFPARHCPERHALWCRGHCHGFAHQDFCWVPMGLPDVCGRVGVPGAGRGGGHETSAVLWGPAAASLEAWDKVLHVLGLTLPIHKTEL